MPLECKSPPTIINCAIFFDDSPSRKETLESIVKPLLEYERLSAAPLPNGEYSQHEFTAESMIRSFTINGTDQLTLDTIEIHLNDDLKERQLPWWELLLVRNEGIGNSSIVLRIEHCLADGISIGDIFDKLITDINGNPIESKTLSKMLQKKSRTNTVNPIAYIKDLFHIFTLESTRYDSPTKFTKPNQSTVYSGKRNVLLLPEISLDLCKKLKNAARCSVNDIILCALSEAIVEYCKDQNCQEIGPDSLCRALVPFGFPRLKEERMDKKYALGNRWCMLSLPMFINEENIVRRLHKIHETTIDIKSSPICMLQIFLQNFLGPLIPTRKNQKMIHNIVSRHSLCMSNVIGPDEPCKLAGKTVVGVQVLNLNFIPQAVFVSYNEVIYGNLTLDSDKIENSHKIATFYAHAFSKLSHEILHENLHDRIN